MSEHADTNVATSKKRSHDEDEGLLASLPSVEISREPQLPTPTSPPPAQTSPQPARQLSPAISVESSALSEARTMTPSALRATPPAATASAATKKRKVNIEEQQLQRALKQSEKDERARKKIEEVERKKQEKLARDEAKRLKEEEKEAAKRKAELERAEKQKAKDAENQAKEEAKRRKEEEKKKKERSQLRLGSFFQKPVIRQASQESSRTSSRRSSVTSLGGIQDPDKEVPIKVSPQKKTEATHIFLPFFVAKYVTLAPTNPPSQEPNLASMAASQLDKWMEQEDTFNTEDAMSTFKSRKRKRCQKPRCTMRQIVESIQGSSTSPIDLTDEGTKLAQLSDVPYKILSFREDVRPPYRGTYTRAVSPQSALKLSRRPFTRQLPNTNYDYDSEAEWEPPNEDDEDLESGDDESDLGEEGEEDMDGFLDDEDDPGRKRQVMGEMAPISSGLCWANSNDRRGPLDEYRIQPLSDDHPFPIDPYSTAYWPKPQQQQQQQQQQHVAKPPAMHPPRLPLSNLNPNRSPSMTPPSVKGDEEPKAEVLCQKPASVTTPSAAAGKPLKLAPDDVLPAFKQAVQGSVLTKAGLVEVLKKQFPKLSKDTIKDTLGHVASRQGAKEADKKWVLKDS